jgi:hypothetical protein
LNKEINLNLKKINEKTPILDPTFVFGYKKKPQEKYNFLKFDEPKKSKNETYLNYKNNTKIEDGKTRYSSLNLNKNFVFGKKSNLDNFGVKECLEN